MIVFAFGVCMILFGPYITDYINTALYRHEHNFLILRFMGIMASIEISGILIAAAGLVGYHKC